MAHFSETSENITLSTSQIKLFRVVNKDNQGRWFFAPSGSSALFMAIQIELGPSPDQLLVLDKTQEMLDPKNPWVTATRKAIEAEAIGMGAFCLSSDHLVDIGWHIAGSVYRHDDPQAFMDSAVKKPAKVEA